MIVTAWSNGKGSYGIRVKARDRVRYFNADWKSITLELDKSIFEHEINIDRLTFKGHGVLVSSEVKFWMQDNLVIPWAPFYPIKLILEPKPERRFLLKRLDDAARGLVPPIQW